MPKFPEPPPVTTLAGIPARILVLHAGSELWRVYFRGGRHPVTWDTFRAYGPVATARFDHHDPPPHVQDRAILYTAAHGPTCVAEVFQDTRVIDRTRRDPWLAAFALAEDVTLLDLTGTWPTMTGASMAISSGPRPRARRWSRAIYDAYPHVQGLWYPSSMYANRPAVALYERAQRALPRVPAFHAPLTHPGLLMPLRHIALTVGYGLV